MRGNGSVQHLRQTAGLRVKSYKDIVCPVATSDSVCPGFKISAGVNSPLPATVPAATTDDAPKESWSAVSRCTA